MIQLERFEIKKRDSIYSKQHPNLQDLVWLFRSLVDQLILDWVLLQNMIDTDFPS